MSNNEPEPGELAEDYAKRLVAEVAPNTFVVSEFNGTPMEAYYGESWELIYLRWHYERLLIQIANGVTTAEKHADHNYLRKYGYEG